MDERLAALEKGFEKLDGKIDKLIEVVGECRLKTSERLSSVDGRLIGIVQNLATKATTPDLKLVEGTVSSIPTTWQIVGLMSGLLVGALGGVAGLAFVLVRYFGKAP